MICYKCGEIIKSTDQIKQGLHYSCFYDWFNVKEGSDFDNVIIKEYNSQKFNTNFKNINSSFFQGKYKKYSALLAGNNYIIKIEDKGFSDLPAAEFLSNQIAYYLGLEVPEFFLIRFENKIKAFVSRNFMDTYKIGNLEHIYHFFSDNREFNCENIINVLKEKTKNISSVERFVELCLFDALIGNYDRHGRNLGLINTPKGYILSPFYDNPSYLAIEAQDLLTAMLDPRGKIVTKKTNEPTMIDYCLEFKRLGYKNIIKKFYEKIKIKEIENMINSSFISEERKEAFKRLIKRRYEELRNELF
ncbi:MAG: HipA domain-containing protein [Candidatus Omnitrophica bacterium]|nr:HipA domain-containing protein [Candidatus Omnitrophota bacterium]MDD5441016.1 HipA domain-containing protein [Candidatus Omnitrophota bacterium]